MLLFGIKNSLNVSYLSLEQEQGAVCTEVPQLLTDKFIGSCDGQWETGNSYSDNKGMYVITFTASEITNDQYTDSLMDFGEIARQYGNVGKNRNGLWQLRALAVLAFSDEDTNIDLVSNVDPSILLNTLVGVGAISDSSGICIGQDKHGDYISASYENAYCALSLEIPITLNNQVVYNNFNGNKNSLLRETCTAAGPWISNSFNPNLA